MEIWIATHTFLTKMQNSERPLFMHTCFYWTYGGHTTLTYSPKIIVWYLQNGKHIWGNMIDPVWGVEHLMQILGVPTRKGVQCISFLPHKCSPQSLLTSANTEFMQWSLFPAKGNGWTTWGSSGLVFRRISISSTYPVDHGAWYFLKATANNFQTLICKAIFFQSIFCEIFYPKYYARNFCQSLNCQNGGNERKVFPLLSGMTDNVAKNIRKVKMAWYIYVIICLTRNTTIF